MVGFSTKVSLTAASTSYYQKKHALVKGWRKIFKNDDLGFYWVQLVNFRKANVPEITDLRRSTQTPQAVMGGPKIK